jgi:hypothetical protein
MSGVFLWGYDSAAGVWRPVLVNSDGKLIIDPSEIFEDPPTDGETAKAPQSNWAYDHWKDPDAHHTAFTEADHLAIGDATPHHAEAHTLASHSTKAHAELTGVGSSDHHVRYADAEAVAAAKTDATLLNYTQGARAYHSADQSIPNASWTTLSLDSEVYDTDTIHNLTTNNSRLTCKTAGNYMIVAMGETLSNATGSRLVQIIYNTSTVIALHGGSPDSFGTGRLGVATLYTLAVNDFIEMQVYQNSGGALLCIYVAGRCPHFMMQRIG